jgi:hypothetical protein
MTRFHIRRRVKTAGIEAGTFLALIVVYVVVCHGPSSWTRVERTK